MPGLPSPVRPSATPARRVNGTLMGRAALLVILFWVFCLVELSGLNR